MYYLGYDIGSSSVKASLYDVAKGGIVATVQYPEIEMDIISRHAGWAEQHPEVWWEHVCQATKLLLSKTGVDPKGIDGIGIAYQMHGLVLVDEHLNVLRPSIIWCDSRAVEIGQLASEVLGAEKCLDHLLNSPGNFTASKLKWVKDNEPDIYERIKYMLFPGDYIAMKLSGEVNTTIPGLSEGILWDYKENGLAHFLLDYYDLSPELIPPVVSTFYSKSRITHKASLSTGLSAGTPICYRAGDQPNNAMALGVLKPNEVAATGGTSGVVYGVVDQLLSDPQSRINSFAHVNHRHADPRIGLLLCINGAGIQYAWLKKHVAPRGITYNDMEQVMSTIPVGSDGLRVVPFGNGAERILSNVNTGAQVNNLQFNRHGKAHFYRAAIEGIAFSFAYGFQVLRTLGLNPQVLRVGNDNLFQSKIFSTTICNLLGCQIEVLPTSGSEGAAKACALGLGRADSLSEIFRNTPVEKTFVPNALNGIYEQAYHTWLSDVNNLVGKKAIHQL